MDRTIPPVFYHSEIIRIIDLWIDEGYESYDKLNDGIKDKLTALCIKVLGNDAYESIVESDNLHQILYHLSKYIETGSRDHALDLAETLHKSSSNYFENILSAIYDERHEEKMYSMNIDNGFIPHKDRTNGEISWHKRGL